MGEHTKEPAFVRAGSPHVYCGTFTENTRRSLVGHYVQLADCSAAADDGQISEAEAMQNAYRIRDFWNALSGIPDPSAVSELIAVLREVEAVMAKNVYPQPDKPESAWGVLCRVRDALAKLTPCTSEGA